MRRLLRGMKGIVHTPIWVGLVLFLTIPVTYALGFKEMGHTLLVMGLAVGVIEIYYKLKYDTTVSEELYKQAKRRPVAFWVWVFFMLLVISFLIAHFWL